MSSNPFASPIKTLTDYASPKKGNSSNNNALIVYHVKPTLPDGFETCEGFALTSVGYISKQMTDPYTYNKSEKEKMSKFFSTNNAVPWTFIIYEDGEPKTREGSNGSEYKMKALVYRAPPGHRCTKESIQDMITETIIPCFKETFDITEGKDPFLPEDWYNTVSTWSDVVGDTVNNGCLKVAQFGFAEGTKNSDVGNFFKNNKGHVYSFWNPGKVPVNTVIKRFRLTDKHLLEDDVHTETGDNQHQG